MLRQRDQLQLLLLNQIVEMEPVWGGEDGVVVCAFKSSDNINHNQNGEHRRAMP